MRANSHDDIMNFFVKIIGKVCDLLPLKLEIYLQPISYHILLLYPLKTRGIETKDYLMFSGGIERDRRHKIGKFTLKKYNTRLFISHFC